MVSLAGKIKTLSKGLEKSDIQQGVSQPDHWLSFNNHVLNFNATTDFTRGVPNRRSVFIWGESGTGKSMIAGNLAKNAQKDGYLVVYIDTEQALHQQYMDKIGLDSDPDKLHVIRASSVGEITDAFSQCFKAFDEDDKVCYVLDSISNLTTESEQVNFSKGVVKGDMGQLAKQLKHMIKNINNKIGSRDNFLIMTGHAYLNQDITNGEGKWISSGGKGFLFLPSVNLLLTKLKLKDEDTKKITGVRITAEISKTRFNQVGRSVRLSVPYSTGIDPYDGLLDLAVETELVSKNGAWFSYTGDDGDVVKFQRKKFEDHVHNLFDLENPSDIIEIMDDSFDPEDEDQ